jgi:hypothetical protein
MPLLEDRNARFDFRKEENLAGKKHFFFAGPKVDHAFHFDVFCSAASYLPATSPFAIFMGTLGLLVSIGAGTFFVKYGTRLAIVEKESAETKQKVDSQAKDLAANSQQTALVAAALAEIRNALNELKTDVKEWMRSHDSHHTPE